MFFEHVTDIPKIAAKTSCSIFVVPEKTIIKLPHALTLTPDDDKKTPTITIEQMRDFISLSANKQTTDQFYVIRPADAMNDAAANAFLKTLEEPSDFCHFVLVTENPSVLLPTILSRAPMFVQKLTGTVDLTPNAKPKTLELAKKLIAATPAQLPSLATDITKNSTKARATALEATSTAIELLYKSYFKTSNQKFLSRLENFIKLHNALSKNGHIKLQIVANLC